MIIVKLFKQENSNEENVISTLFEGEHIIGRETPLNCGDKRISRKHAIISVKQDGVTLKSVHVNPCYFRTSQNNNVEILKKNNCITLNDGVQFSMLSKSDWFKVKITTDNPSENEPPTLCDNPNRSKRSHDEDNSNRTHKKLKSDEEAHNVNNQHPSINSIQHQEIIDAVDVLINNLDNICEEESEDISERLVGLNYTDPIRQDKVEELNNNVNGTDDGSRNKMNLTDLQKSGDGVDTENAPILNSAADVCSVNLQNSCLREFSNENTTIVQIENTVGRIFSPVSETCVPQNANEHETSHIDQTHSTEGQNVPIQVNTAETDRSDLISTEDIKKEPECMSEDNIVPSTSVKEEPVCMSEDNIVPSTSVKEEPVSDENIKQEPDNTPDVTNPIPNDPSTSNNPSNMRRDRCWYGHNCYRKNPAHRLNISHPSDNDYDSDPNDVRAICPYGRACYRVNPQHRKEFKHYGKPAPKPTNIRLVVNVNNSCRPQCKNNKPGYESDPGDEL